MQLSHVKKDGMFKRGFVDHKRIHYELLSQSGWKWHKLSPLDHQESPESSFIYFLSWKMLLNDMGRGAKIRLQKKVRISTDFYHFR